MILPRSLAGFTSGHLPSGILRSVGPGLLHVTAARAFEALRSAAEATGLALVVTSAYRPYTGAPAENDEESVLGLGLAVTLAPSSDDGRWLAGEAWRYGWSWDDPLLVYVDGDAVPPAVIEHEQGGRRDYPVLRVGSIGRYVSYLQRVLRFTDRSVVVDGLFGPETLRAVREVQRRSRLTEDGVIGPETWTAVRDAGDRQKVPLP